MTNWSDIEENWPGYKFLFHDEWPQIPEEDLDRIGGHRDVMAEAVSRYAGRSIEEAEQDIEDWAKRMTYAHDSASAQWNMLMGYWTSFKGKVREKWADFSDDEISQMEGRRAQVVGALQKKYGWSLEEAERRADDWVRSLTNV